MIKTIPYRQGQSIYDLCLQAYGTLDLLIKFCIDNNVQEVSDTPTLKEYKYDTALVKFEGNTKLFGTMLEVTEAHLITEDGSQYLITEDAEQYLIA